MKGIFISNQLIRKIRGIMNNNEYTPEPGDEIKADKAKGIIKKFLDKYRKDDVNIPSNLPTACQLNGIKKAEVLKSSKFLNYNKVFYYFDSSDSTFEAYPNDIFEYYCRRLPWEDYDFCIFDFEMKWCIGITHNDDVILEDPEGILI